MRAADASDAPETVAPSGFFVLRTPLLPADELFAWSDGCLAPAAPPAALDAALAADRARLRERLRALVARDDVREALFVASPSLDESLPLWRDAPDGERGLKVERALVRYFARMAARATPFGLFAGWSLGVTGTATELTVPPRAEARRSTRLDMDYVFALCEALSPALRDRLRFRPSTSAYRAGGRVRYVEASVQGRARSHRLVAVDDTAALRLLLERAAAGATIAELVDCLCAARPRVTHAQARAYVDELLAARLLVSELAPPVTGADPLADLIEQLAEPAATVAAPLCRARDALRGIDREQLGVAPARYREVASMLAGLPVDAELGRLFQVDLHKAGGAAPTLGDRVVGELGRAVELLRRISPPTGDGLARFREAFTRRFEAREVPLVEALDEELGVGFGPTPGSRGDASPLLDGLPFAPPEREPPRWTARHAHLLARVERSLRDGEHELVLDEADVAALAVASPPPLPDAFAIAATVVASDTAAVDEGAFRLLFGGCSGPSGARMLGRFCADEELAAVVRSHLRAEEALRPDAIFAEVVHLPEGRAGNVLLRPLLREYEIAFLGRSGAPPDRQLTVDDLLVSVRNDRVVLRSRRLDREIVPRLTAAHNYAGRALGVYRFFGALQTQGVAGAIRFDWGPLAGSCAFLPRVIHGRVVLARARWRLDAAQLGGLARARDGNAQWRAVQALRRSARLPRHVVVEDGDNQLPVDLDNVLAVETFVQLVRARTEVTLTELYPGAQELCARGADGRFVHELIVPFVRCAPTTAAAAPIAAAPTAPSVTRSFAPGSEWLYAKLYTGAATADRLLRDVVAPLVTRAVAERWFFLRYADPDPHLRVRLHGDPRTLISTALPLLYDLTGPLLQSGVVWRLQLDTYERELERYGGPLAIDAVERLFHVDSEAALALCLAHPGDTDARWRLALAGSDRLLCELGLDLSARHALAVASRDALGAEYRVDTQVQRRLGERYRAERVGLERLLAGDAGALAGGLDVLAARSRRWSDALSTLEPHLRAGRTTASRTALAASLVHMHVNRVLRGRPREHELVIYDFLARLYDGQLARGRRS